MLTLLVFGSVGFWILVSLVALLIFWMTEIEQPGWATLMLIVTFVALAYLGDFNLWHAIKGNPMGAIVACAAYVGVGAAWSVGKWWFFVHACRAIYQEVRDEFMERYNLDKSGDIPDHQKQDFQFKVEHGSKEAAKPLIRENKSRITIWMTYWPWSMTWTLINDPVKKMFRWVYHQLQAVYQSIADHGYRSVEKDFVITSPPAAKVEGAEVSAPIADALRRSAK